MGLQLGNANQVASIDAFLTIGRPEGPSSLSPGQRPGNTASHKPRWPEGPRYVAPSGQEMISVPLSPGRCPGLRNPAPLALGRNTSWALGRPGARPKGPPSLSQGHRPGNMASHKPRWTEGPRYVAPSGQEMISVALSPGRCPGLRNPAPLALGKRVALALGRHASSALGSNGIFSNRRALVRDREALSLACPAARPKGPSSLSPGQRPGNTASYKPIRPESPLMGCV